MEKNIFSGGNLYSKSSPKYHCEKCDKDFDCNLRELQIDDYYKPQYSDEDYIDTKKYDDLSLEELEKEIEIEKKKYEKYMENNRKN